MFFFFFFFQAEDGIRDWSVTGVQTCALPISFGYEYFLRAERLSAGLRWSGLLRGHFQFGTLSFSRPSLILVRNFQVQWNLERWLPPAKAASAQGPPIYSPASPAPPVNHLQRSELDAGCVSSHTPYD